MVKYLTLEIDGVEEPNWGAEGAAVDYDKVNASCNTTMSHHEYSCSSEIYSDNTLKMKEI